MYTKKEEAVSPVIGVILMVAITVILAAVIAAFVFGMTGNVQKTKNVAFTVERSSSSTTQVIVTSQGGKDSADISSTLVSIDGSTGTAGPTTIGSYKTIGGASQTAKSKVVVTATFKDGSKQVVVDTSV
ncbi:type IV pilin N-terminal domain-containing protein [Methanospirillum lacunae]|uniref:Type IV pilin n=1 Tax=Methanospirillum lacunae TaxID=668570 RepID=A0A2V2N8G2_9EURY|nr:type IV pilin N-terminal domain-containing protein [Methanospirillum lacunae]PWR71573.1 type IV pilin [Methanospirillum lacunae]